MIKVSKNGIAMLENKAQGPYFHQCNLSTMLTQLDHMIIPQSAIKNHSRVPISGEQKIEIICRVRNHVKSILSDRSNQDFVLKLHQSKLVFIIFNPHKELQRDPKVSTREKIIKTCINPYAQITPMSPWESAS